ncbi:hypothetical protein Csa_019309 [Cucumis sativus]|uniref:Uncharacterized protein n=1 Tax=Cucumis sativus TaxID=3659 RepID=A0A0A0LJ66_CUCSA|nr:hypothetical protein Csa_019309 [Cucumis sativus]
MGGNEGLRDVLRGREGWSVSVADKEYMDPRGITRTVGTTWKRTCQPPTSHPVDRRLRDLYAPPASQNGSTIHL